VTGLLPEMIICCKYSGVATEFASHAPEMRLCPMKGRMFVRIDHLANQKSNSTAKHQQISQQTDSKKSRYF
jgi:hypothetical protein